MTQHTMKNTNLVSCSCSIIPDRCFIPTQASTIRGATWRSIVVLGIYNNNSRISIVRFILTYIGREPSTSPSRTPDHDCLCGHETAHHEKHKPCSVQFSCSIIPPAGGPRGRARGRAEPSTSPSRTPYRDCLCGYETAHHENTTTTTWNYH